MKYFGIEFETKHRSAPDANFIPFGIWHQAYLQNATQPIAIAIARNGGQVSVHRTCIHCTVETAGGKCYVL